MAYSFHIVLQPHCGQGAGGRSARTASSGSGGRLCGLGLAPFSGWAASRPVAAGISRLHTGQIMRWAPLLYALANPLSQREAGLALKQGAVFPHLSQMNVYLCPGSVPGEPCMLI